MCNVKLHFTVVQLLNWLDELRPSKNNLFIHAHKRIQNFDRIAWKEQVTMEV
jgi:hypothetical protein